MLIVGCGDLGGYTAKLLQAANFNVYALRRSGQAFSSIQTIQGDVTKPASLATLSDLKPDYVIYCVSADQRTDAAYQAQYVTGLQNVLATQQTNAALRGVLFVSSTRVYGQTTEELIDQRTEAIPADFGGHRLLEAEQLLDSIPCQTVALRLSGIYGEGRLRMIRLAQQAQWPMQNAWSNRIHRNDAASFMVHLIQQLRAGQSLKSHYIVTDNLPTRQYTVLRWIAAQMDWSISDQIPEDAGGKRLSNQAMLATGFALGYPDFKAGYAALLSNQTS